MIELAVKDSLKICLIESLTVVKSTNAVKCYKFRDHSKVCRTDIAPIIGEKYGGDDSTLYNDFALGSPSLWRAKWLVNILSYP